MRGRSRGRWRRWKRRRLVWRPDPLPSSAWAAAYRSRRRVGACCERSAGGGGGGRLPAWRRGRRAGCALDEQLQAACHQVGGGGRVAVDLTRVALHAPARAEDGTRPHVAHQRRSALLARLRHQKAPRDQLLHRWAVRRLRLATASTDSAVGVAALAHTRKREELALPPHAQHLELDELVVAQRVYPQHLPDVGAHLARPRAHVVLVHRSRRRIVRVSARRVARLQRLQRLQRQLRRRTIVAMDTGPGLHAGICRHARRPLLHQPGDGASAGAQELGRRDGEVLSGCAAPSKDGRLRRHQQLVHHNAHRRQHARRQRPDSPRLEARHGLGLLGRRQPGAFRVRAVPQQVLRVDPIAAAGHHEHWLTVDDEDERLGHAAVVWQPERRRGLLRGLVWAWRADNRCLDALLSDIGRDWPFSWPAAQHERDSCWKARDLHRNRAETTFPSFPRARVQPIYSCPARGRPGSPAQHR